MHISFERSGGFAGNIRFKAEADTKSRQLTRGAARMSRELSTDESAHLEELVQKIDFESAAQNRSRGPGKVDNFQYDLTVETDDGQQHTLHIGESAATGPLMDLIEHLTKLSKER
ncbi:MAG TPA: protealysin inhibitor emfourin [Pyrinomonadaceae bacterium]|nr:protealysin inhibitor emfourin [Pyrinomonadaceae bacterium]